MRKFPSRAMPRQQVVLILLLSAIGPAGCTTSFPTSAPPGIDPADSDSQFNPTASPPSDVPLDFPLEDPPISFEESPAPQTEPSATSPPAPGLQGDVPPDLPLPSVDISDSSVTRWMEHGSFILSLNDDASIAIDLIYVLDADSTLVSVEMAESEESLAAKFHSAYAAGSPAVTTEVVSMADSIQAGEGVQLWLVRIESALWGDIELTTELTFYRGDWTETPDGQVEWTLGVRRSDTTTMDDNAFSSTYDISGVQTGSISPDSQQVIWTLTTGSVAIGHDPPCTSQCPEIMDLSENDSVGQWDRIR